MSGHTFARIVWVDRDNRDAVWLSRNDTGAWVSSRLWIGKAFNPKVANLGNGLAVVFSDGSDRLRYLTWDPVSGPSSAAVVARACCHGLSLAVHHGHPAIAFSATGGPLRYWRPGSLTTVDSHATTDPTLSLDLGGHPLIAYSSGGIWYAHDGAAGWTTRHVLGTAYSEPYIAADGTGIVAIAAHGRNTSRDWIAFKRLDVSASVVSLASYGAANDGGPGQPFLALSAGRGIAAFRFSCGCIDAAVWVTRQH